MVNDHQRIGTYNFKIISITIKYNIDIYKGIIGILLSGESKMQF